LHDIGWYTIIGIIQSIQSIKTIANYFGLTIDQLVNEETMPSEVAIEDKNLLEQVKLINDL
jgi:hypothetical protein